MQADICFFCHNQCTNDFIDYIKIQDVSDNQKLCTKCLSDIFEYSCTHYKTDDIEKMKRLSMTNDDAITFLYETIEKAETRDTSGSIFMIDTLRPIVGVCARREHDCPRANTDFVTLNDSFWDQLSSHQVKC
jgi:hypothetical protein